MLQVNLTDCSDCLNLKNLLEEIDDRLDCYATNEYHKITLMVSLPSNTEVIKDLLYYKDIVTKKMFYPPYASEINLADIYSRIKILLYK